MDDDLTMTVETVAWVVAMTLHQPYHHDHQRRAVTTPLLPSGVFTDQDAVLDACATMAQRELDEFAVEQVLDHPDARHGDGDADLDQWREARVASGRCTGYETFAPMAVPLFVTRYELAAQHPASPEHVSSPGTAS